MKYLLNYYTPMENKRTELMSRYRHLQRITIT